MDAQRDALAGGLVAGDTLDVDHVLETVHGGDLALTALVGATDNGDLVVLADGDAADLLEEVLATGISQAATRGFFFSSEGRDVRCTSHGAPWREGRS